MPFGTADYISDFIKGKRKEVGVLEAQPVPTAIGASAKIGVDSAALPPAKDLLTSLGARTTDAQRTTGTDIAEGASRAVTGLGKTIGTDPLGLLLEGVTAFGAGGFDAANVDVPRLQELQRVAGVEDDSFFQRVFPETALAGKSLGLFGGLEGLEKYSALTPAQIAERLGTLPPEGTTAPAATTTAPTTDITTSIAGAGGQGSLTFAPSARSITQAQTTGDFSGAGGAGGNTFAGLSKQDRARVKSLFIRDKQYSNALALADTPQERSSILREQKRSGIERALRNNPGLDRGTRQLYMQQLKTLTAADVADTTAAAAGTPKFADLLKAQTTRRGQDIDTQRNAFRAYTQSFLDADGQPLPGAPDFGEFTAAYASGDQAKLAAISQNYAINRQLTQFKPEDVAQAKAVVAAKGGTAQDVLATLQAAGR